MILRFKSEFIQKSVVRLLLVGVILVMHGNCIGQVNSGIHTVGSRSMGDTVRPIVQPELKNNEKTFAPSGVDIYYLPLFGDYLKTEEQQVSDEVFKSDCDAQFSNRKEAGDFFIKMGWQYLKEGSKTLATHRFNLAYLLSPENYEIYWGLGVVEFQNGKFAEALALMNKGLRYCDDTRYIFWTDLATVNIKLASLRSENSLEVTNARTLLERAISFQPNYAQAYIQLTILNMLENKNAEAWVTFHKAYNLNPAEITRDLLLSLLERQEDPLGKFKKN